MDSKKRGAGELGSNYAQPFPSMEMRFLAVCLLSEINPRYKKIIRSMHLNNFLLTINNGVMTSEMNFEEGGDDPFCEDPAQVGNLCG